MGLGLGLGLGLRSGGSGGEPWYTLGKADGVDPTFWADFINNRYAVNGVEYAYSDLFTHTRSTTGTRFNSSGQMVTEAINEPRFNFDPVTLATKGLLLEEQRTNILTRSDVPFTSWSTSGGSKTASGDTFLGYFTNGAVIATSGVIWNGQVVATTNWVSGTVYSWSLFVKAGTSGKVLMYLRDYTAGIESAMEGTLGTTLTAINVSAGAITNTNFISVDGGYIYYGTFTPNSTPLSSTLRISPASLVAGETVIVYGAQLEAGAFPTSFIATAAGAVTRGADSILNSSANVVPFASWYNATEGCFNPTFKYIGMTVAEYPKIMMATDAGETNRIGVLINDSATPTVDFHSFVGGTYQGIGTPALNPTNIITKAAGSYKNNDGAIARNGASPTTDAVFGIPTVDRLKVISAAIPTCVYMREARYYNQRITNAELTRITT